MALEIKRLIASGAIGKVVGGEGRIAAGRLQRYIDGHSPWMLEKISVTSSVAGMGEG